MIGVTSRGVLEMALAGARVDCFVGSARRRGGARVSAGERAGCCAPMGRACSERAVAGTDEGGGVDEIWSCGAADRPAVSLMLLRQDVTLGATAAGNVWCYHFLPIRAEMFWAQTLRTCTGTLDAADWGDQFA